MRNKPINTLREKYTFKDCRREYNGGVAFKGYCDEDGYFMGLTILYNLNGKLMSIGSYTDNPQITRNRKIGYWKDYDENGNLQMETIHIRDNN